MKLHISDDGGELLTAHIRFSIMGKPVDACLSGLLAYALYDGLLWWALNRKLEAFWSTAQVVPPATENQHAHQVIDALNVYVATTPFYETTEERQKRIVDTIYNRLPDLASEHAELVQLAQLLRDRITHSGDANHGLEGILVNETPAAKAA